MVDVLVVNVILDMYELTAIRLSVIETLAGSSYPTRSWSWVRLHYACGWMRMCVEFRDEILLRRGDCETPENSNFLKKGKIVISVKIRNFSRSRMTKQISLLESSR